MNEEQKLVLKVLKHRCGHDYPLGYPLGVIAEFAEAVNDGTYSHKFCKAYYGLSATKEFEVLAAFAEWGLKNEN